MSTDVPVRQYTCSVDFFFFGITDPPKVNLPVHPHASQGEPVSSATCVPAHR